MKKGFAAPAEVQPTTLSVLVAHVMELVQTKGSDSVSARHPHVLSLIQEFWVVCLFIMAQSCLIRTSSAEGPSVGLGVHPFAPSWADAFVSRGNR